MKKIFPDSAIKYISILPNSCKMLIGFSIIISGLGCLMTLERIFPDQKLKPVKNWWVRVLTINVFQLLLVVLASKTWEAWLQVDCLLQLGKWTNPMMGGFIAYLINTWIFYWWHRFRHESRFLWLICHQMHHSASRIETITSFYKHPLEIFLDSVLMTILIFPILGLGPESSIWLSGFSAFGEYFYHMNIKTPHWIGYIFQRPESHRVHHLKNKRYDCKNYSDIPVLDMLGGTFYNPVEMNDETGFDEVAEGKFMQMLLFEDVIHKGSKPDRILWGEFRMSLIVLVLLIVGLLQPAGYILKSPTISGVAFATASSPLPLVFTTYNQIETFSTDFTLKGELSNGSIIIRNINKELYDRIDGPYNRRNVFGVVFSHGPFFNTEELIKLRQRVLYYAICLDGIKLDLGSHAVRKVEIKVRSKARGFENKQWIMTIECD